MTFLNKAKEVAKKTSDKANEIKQNQIEKKEAEAELNKDNPEWLFKATNIIGDLEVDSVNNLFRVKNAKSELSKTKKKGLVSKASNAALFVGTAGMSSAIKATAKGVKHLARKPDSVYRFNELVEFELIEDDSQVTTGGVGRALVGGALFGNTGAIVGGVTGKKKTNKIIESLIIRITVNDIDNPIILLPIISSKTKTSSKEYTSAFNQAQKIISTLNVIANDKKENFIQKVEVIETPENGGHDPYEQLKKMKELLDVGIITQEEFDAKKKEILK